MTIDLRTRYDDNVETIDVVEFFEDRLRRLSEKHSVLAVPGARELGVRPLTIETPVGSWTLSVAGDAIGVAPGADGQATVRLDESELGDIVDDLRTPMTLFTAGTLDMPHGRLEDFLDWWVLLRSLLDGRPVHTAGSIEFNDRNGEPLDLHQSFAPDDDPSDAAALPVRSRIPPPHRRVQLRGDGAGFGGHGHCLFFVQARRRPFLVGHDGGRPAATRPTSVVPRAQSHDGGHPPGRPLVAHRFTNW